MRMAATSRSRIDWGLILAALALLILGTAAVLSAASQMSFYSAVMKKHFIAVAIGVVLFLFGFGFNYQVYQDQAKTIYVLVLIMMVSVLVFGVLQRGQRSWFNFSILTFQPVELARLGIVLVLANYLDRNARKVHDPSIIFWAMLIVGPVMVLVLKQPDFASMLTFLPIVIGMLFCAGANLVQLFTLIGFGALSLSYPILFTLFQIRYPDAEPGSFVYFFLMTSKMGMSTAIAVGGIVVGAFAAWRLSGMLRMQLRGLGFVIVPIVLVIGLLSGIVVNKQLKGYQRNRVVAFLSPEADILGASYNVNQSEIAIGSGGLWGKGLFSGTQSRLGFLPERHTDFIYAVVGEEMGFVGAMGVLGLYVFLIWRITVAARYARDRYGYLVCCGLASMFAFHLFFNVGMCLGLAPVAGIPLPLISYGGSSLVVTLLSLGIVANVYSRRYSFV